MEYSYQVVLSNGAFVNITTSEDLIAKYEQARADRNAYLKWEKGCFAMYNLTGVFRW